MPDNTIVRKMRQGYRLYRVGTEEPKTTVLVSPDGENSEPIPFERFQYLNKNEVIRPYDYSNEGRIEFVLRPNPVSLSKWVEIPMSGEMKICSEAPPSENETPQQKQQQHTYLDGK